MRIRLALSISICTHVCGVKILVISVGSFLQYKPVKGGDVRPVVINSAHCASRPDKIQLADSVKRDRRIYLWP